MDTEEDYGIIPDPEPTEIKVAIVGSREFKNYELLKRTMREFVARNGQPSLMVSGGAKGADTLGEKWADENNVKKLILKPDWSKGTIENSLHAKTKGKSAGIVRNFDIVAAATHVVAFPSKNSKGTFHTMKVAKAKGIPVTEVYWD